MYWLTKFNVLGTDYTLPSILPSQYVGSGAIDSNIFTPLPSGGVFDNYGSDPAPAAQQLIRATGGIAAKGITASALETLEKNLRSLRGKRGSLYRQWDNSGDSQFCDARMESFNATRNLPGVRLDIDIVFQMISAAWSGSAISETFTKAAITAASGVVSVTNGGNENQDDVVITITGSGSNITAVTIQKTSASGATIYDELTWSGTLAAAQKLVIDCGAYTVEKQGVSDYDNFALGANHREDHWFRLWASANRIVISITGGDNSATVKFEGYDAWK